MKIIKAFGHVPIADYCELSFIIGSRPNEGNVPHVCTCPSLWQLAGTPRYNAGYFTVTRIPGIVKGLYPVVKGSARGLRGVLVRSGVGRNRCDFLEAGAIQRPFYPKPGLVTRIVGPAQRDTV